MPPPSTLQPTLGAVVVGAASGLGAALARRLAREGYLVALIAPRADLLNAVAEDIKSKGGRACVYVHDVTHYDEVPAVFQTILRDLGRIDLIAYVAGVMAPPGAPDFNFEQDRIIMEVNVLGAMAWLNQAAVLFERIGRGSIVGISSVAGDRGRVANLSYNTSKAALTTFLEALRNRLTRKGVHVLTVKPGMMNTDLLKGVKRTLWVISPEQAADDIWKAIKGRKQQIYTSARWGPFMFILRNIPSFIFRKLSI